MVNVFQGVLEYLPWLFPCAGIVLGGVFGSFAGCMISRMKAGENLRYPPSKCDTCNRKLSAIDLVPIFSYAFLRGKCRTCGAQIGALTFWLELGGALLLGALLFCITQVL